MTVEILSTGCSKCTALLHNAKEAVRLVGHPTDVKVVDNIHEIMAHGVTCPPGLVIDGKLRSTGVLLSVKELVEIFG